MASAEARFHPAPDASVRRGRAVRPDLGLAVVACVATWLVFVPFAPLAVDVHHDGIMLKPALDVWHGKVVFRDTFCQYGVLTPYLHAVAFAAFGPRLLALRLATVLLYGLAAGALVLTWRVFVPRSLALAALGIWLVRTPFLSGPPMRPWSSVPALCFQAAALWGLLLATMKASARGAFAAGVFAGMTFLARQQVGAATAVALALALLLPRQTAERGRLVVVYLAGVGLVIGAFAAYLLGTGSVRPWLEQTVVWPSRWAVSGVGGVPSLLPSARESVHVFALVLGGLLVLRLCRARPRARWLAAAAVAVVVGGAAGEPWFLFGVTGALVLGLLAALAADIVRLVRDRARDPLDVAVAGALLVATAAWLQMYPRTDLDHPHWALAPATGLVVHAAWRASGRQTALVAILLAAMFGPTARYVAAAARARVAATNVRLAVPEILAGMKVDATAADDWERLARAIAAHPDAGVLVEGRDALYATLGRRSADAGPLYVVWPGLDRGDVARRIALIARERPLVFREGAARLEVQRAMDAAGYRVLVSVPDGSLLAPEQAPG